WGRFERAREAGRIARMIGATRMADGHTLDDQAETILMGLVLGWGLDGMGGIAPVNGTLVRPLLDVRRTEVEAFCRALHLRPRRSHRGSSVVASSGRTSAGTTRRSTPCSTWRPVHPGGRATSCSGSRRGARARTSRSRGRLAASVETYADDIENVLIKADEIES